VDGYNGLSKKKEIRLDMSDIIEDTINVLKSMGISSYRVSTPPGYAGIQVNLPNDAQAFFVWTKIDQFDYHFRLARFWANENPFSMWVSPNLIEALAKTRVLANQ
jgi:hypothetical protein